MKSIATALLVLTFLTLCVSVGQAGDRSLPNIDSESSEVTALVALEKLLAENRRLRSESEETRKLVANSTAESEIFKRQVQELMLRMEALGSSTTDPSKLEQRLLQAVHDLQLSDQHRKTLSSSLMRIVQLAQAFIEESNAESKMVLQTEIKNAEETLVKAAVSDFAALEKMATETPANLQSGKISAVKPELRCVVINLGTKHGVKVGMPFQVRRGQTLIATVRVVDARQAFAGTVIQNLISDKEPIKLGDTIRVDAQLN